MIGDKIWEAVLTTRYHKIPQALTTTKIDWFISKRYLGSSKRLHDKLKECNCESKIQRLSIILPQRILSSTPLKVLEQYRHRSIYLPTIKIFVSLKIRNRILMRISNTSIAHYITGIFFWVLDCIVAKPNMN